MQSFLDNRIIFSIYSNINLLLFANNWSYSANFNRQVFSTVNLLNWFFIQSVDSDFVSKIHFLSSVNIFDVKNIPLEYFLKVSIFSLNLYDIFFD